VIEPGNEFLDIRSLKVHYGSYEAIQDVSLTIPKGKLVSLLGANASGKSTILKTISGLHRPTHGQILFEGHRVDRLPPHEIVKMGIAHVAEGRRLFTNMSVGDNLRLGLYGGRNRNKHEKQREFEDIYKRFPILLEKSKLLAMTLSGGEAQILAIARSLMSKPRLLLMDEPLQALSPVMREEVVSIVTQLRETGLTILMVEHNVTTAFDISDLVYILDNGEIILQGKPQDLSGTEYVQKHYLGV